MVKGFMYRGYTMAQLDEIIDFAKQQMFEPGEKRQMIRSYTPMQFIPPALFSPEQLEQIRAIMRKEVREEVRVALNENESERIMQATDDISTDEQEAFLKGQRKAV